MEDSKIEDKKLLRMSKVRLCEESVTLIKELNSVYGHIKDKIGILIISLRDNDHLNNDEIKHVLLKEVKFCSRASIYNSLPEEMKRDYERFEDSKTTLDEPGTDEQEESEFDKQREKAEEGGTTVIDDNDYDNAISFTISINDILSTRDIIESNLFRCQKKGWENVNVFLTQGIIQ